MSKLHPQWIIFWEMKYKVLHEGYCGQTLFGFHFVISFSDFILASLLLTLNRLLILAWCFHCWSWTSKCRLGDNYPSWNYSKVFCKKSLSPFKENSFPQVRNNKSWSLNFPWKFWVFGLIQNGFTKTLQLNAHWYRWKWCNWLVNVIGK